MAAQLLNIWMQMSDFALLQMFAAVYNTVIGVWGGGSLQPGDDDGDDEPRIL